MPNTLLSRDILMTCLYWNTRNEEVSTAIGNGERLFHCASVYITIDYHAGNGCSQTARQAPVTLTHAPN